MGEGQSSLQQTLHGGLDARRDIPQIEFIAGDARTALVFRHLQPLSDADKARLEAFGAEHGFAIFLQPGGIDSVQPLAGAAADRWGPRPVLVAGILILALGTALTPLPQ